jgi:hypothetical protein
MGGHKMYFSIINTNGHENRLYWKQAINLKNIPRKGSFYKYLITNKVYSRVRTGAD